MLTRKTRANMKSPYPIVRETLAALEQQLSRGREASVSDATDGIAYVLLIVCVLVAPFPWGAILPGGNFMIEAFAFAIAALAFASRRQEDTIGPAAIPPLALIAIAVLGLIQLIPMSPQGLRRISPASAKVYDGANAVLALFGRRNIVSRISIAPSETRN